MNGAHQTRRRLLCNGLLILTGTAVFQGRTRSEAEAVEPELMTRIREFASWVKVSPGSGCLEIRCGVRDHGALARMGGSLAGDGKRVRACGPVLSFQQGGREVRITIVKETV